MWAGRGQSVPRASTVAKEVVLLPALLWAAAWKVPSIMTTCLTLPLASIAADVVAAAPSSHTIT